MTSFEEIYRNNLWRAEPNDSRSGPGSSEPATRKTARMVHALALLLEAETCLDLACGDSWWMPPLPGYIGCDVSPTAVARAQTRNPGRDYRVLDGRVDPLPDVDLVILRDVVQHLPLDDGEKLVSRIAHTKSRWLLASTFVGGYNEDVTPPTAYRNDLALQPFQLGEPMIWLPDGWGYRDADVIRDPTKFLGLWRLNK